MGEDSNCKGGRGFYDEWNHHPGRGLVTVKWIGTRESVGWLGTALLYLLDAACAFEACRSFTIGPLLSVLYYRSFTIGPAELLLL